MLVHLLIFPRIYDFAAVPQPRMVQKLDLLDSIARQHLRARRVLGGRIPGCSPLLTPSASFSWFWQVG